MLGDPIAELRSPSGSLISVFVDRPSPGGFSALLSDVTRPVKEKSTSLGRIAEKSVRADLRRIHGLADEFEANSEPSYAIFASHADDIFMVEPLAHSSQNIAAVGPRPYLRPLRAAPRELRSGVLVADRSIARTFIGYEGHIREIGAAINADLGKGNYGGFAGYEEHTVRAHAGEESNRVWRGAAARLLDEHQGRPLDYLAIGGPQATLDEVGHQLHPYLSRLPRITFLANPATSSPTSLRAELRGLDDEIRHRRQVALAGRVCDTAWSGGNGVLGLGPVIEAANAQAVDVLVVAGPYSRDGRICAECGRLARVDENCPVDGASTFVVDDVVGAAMDATVAAGGSVHQIAVATALDAEGIGALTRFPVAV